MYNSAFSAISLRGELKSKDFQAARKEDLNAWLVDQVQKAVEISVDGFEACMSLRQEFRKGKAVWVVESLPQQLVIRKISNNIRRLTWVKQASRDIIVGDLIGFLKSDINYRIYKLDIQSFYESVSPEILISRLYRDTSVSRSTARLVKSFFCELSNKRIVGLPRGISLSATLSELFIRDFDAAVLASEKVFFYNRYVDDLIVITDGTENPKDFVSWLGDKLPGELKFNDCKTDIGCILRQPKKNDFGKIRHCFNFLGYELTIQNPAQEHCARGVLVDICESKSKRIKTKIALSLLSFNKNSNFELLDMRIRYLTSNYAIYDPDQDRIRMAGIFYNYKRVNVEDRLRELDLYFKAMLLGGGGKLSAGIMELITREQRRKLLSYSFCRGFASRIKYHFSSADYRSIKRCWVNV